MKKSLKYILLSLLLLMQLSCDKWMDLTPPNGLISDEFWKSKEDVESVLMAAYETFSDMDKALFLYGELRADFLKGDNNQDSDEQDIMENNIFKISIEGL